ncbi:MAG: hypothetical protein V4760_12570 [Bdellovibrionota bacterium]
MLAHNVIILTAGRSHELGRGRIDQLIDFVTAMKKTPILVLGPDADDLLRQINRHDECEFVFDPNFEGEEFSSIKAGLQATGEACFIIRASSTLPDRATFALLERELLASGTSGVDVFAHPDHDDSRAVYLVTQRGVASLKKQPASARWLKSNDLVFGLVHAHDKLPSVG